MPAHPSIGSPHPSQASSHTEGTEPNFGLVKFFLNEVPKDLASKLMQNHPQVAATLRLVNKEAAEKFNHMLPALAQFYKALDDTKGLLPAKLGLHRPYPSIHEIIKALKELQPDTSKKLPYTDRDFYDNALTKLVGAVYENETWQLDQAPQYWRTALTEFLSDPEHGLSEKSSLLWEFTVDTLNKLQRLYPAGTNQPIEGQATQTQSAIEVQIGETLNAIVTAKQKALKTIEQFTQNTRPEEIQNFLKRLPEQLKKNPEIAVSILYRKTDFLTAYLTQANLDLTVRAELNSYKHIVNHTVKISSFCLQHAQLNRLNLDKPDQLAAYKSIATTAVTQNGYALQYAQLNLLNLDKPDQLAAYKEIVTTAVTEDGHILQHAQLNLLNLDNPEHFAAYKSIATTAVTENGYVLQHAQLNLLNLDNPDHFATTKQILEGAVSHLGHQIVINHLKFTADGNSSNDKLRYDTLLTILTVEPKNLDPSKPAHLAVLFGIRLNDKDTDQVPKLWVLKMHQAWQRCKAHITPAFATCFTGQQDQPPSPPQP